MKLINADKLKRRLEILAEKKLEQQEKHKCISGEASYYIKGKMHAYSTVVDMLDLEPAVEPNDEVEQAFREGYAAGRDSARKISTWVLSEGEYYCKCCGGTAPLAHSHKHTVTTAFCPHCGAIM